MHRQNSILLHVGKLSLPLKMILKHVGMTGEIQCRQLVSVLTSQTGNSEFVLFLLFAMKTLHAQFLYKQIFAFQYRFVIALEHFTKWDVGVWTGWRWLRTRTIVGHL